MFLSDDANIGKNLLINNKFLLKKIKPGKIIRRYVHNKQLQKGDLKGNFFQSFYFQFSRGSGFT